jgi:hypothetical protein
MIDAARQAGCSPGEVAVPAGAPRLRTHTASAGRWRSAVITGVVAVVLLALLLVPRLSDLDALVTPDEPLWVGRSANFYQALSSGNLKDTYQYVHPGVPVMWMGALAFAITTPELPDLLGGQINERNNEFREIVTPAGYNLADMLVDLRMAVSIFSALVVIGLFFCLIPLVGRWTAAAAIGMIALNPMHIGYTRLLHLDGLSANLLLLSVVAFCVYLQRHSRGYLIVSAIATGIAVLTRSANGVLAPLVAMLAVVDIGLNWWTLRQPIQPLVRRYALALLLWGGIALVTCVVIWPALWVAPLDTIRGMWNGGIDLATDPHARQILFRGEVTTDDPGWLYYPVVLMYRISPFSLVGMMLAVSMAVLPRSQGVMLHRRLCLNLGLFAGAYMVILSLAAKKLDRYMLPSIVAFDLIAIFGWVAFARWIAGRLTPRDTRLSRMTAVALIAVVLIGQGTLALDTRPYYLNAASPVFGGTSGASEQLSFGWGEGGKQVAEAIETIPNVSESLVLVGPWPMSVDYYLPYRLKLPIYELTPRSADLWLDADYVVLSAPEVQRQLYPPAMLDWFDQQTPMMLVMDGGGMMCCPRPTTRRRNRRW